MFTKLLICSCFSVTILTDWGFIIDGTILVGEGSTSEYIYSRIPETRITPQDRLILTGQSDGEEPQKTTGVIEKKVEPPRMPPIRLSNLSSRIFPGLIVGPRATDLPAHMKAGHFPPNIPESMIFRRVFEDRMRLIENFKVEDKLADELGYDFYDTSDARTEVFFECFLILLAKEFSYNKTFDYEDKFFLTLYGDPAADAALRNSSFKYPEFDEGYIGPEKEPPEFIRGQEEFETMMYKLVTLELFCNYPFSMISQFAPGLDYFAPEFVYPYVKTILEQSKNR